MDIKKLIKVGELETDDQTFDVWFEVSSRYGNTLYKPLLEVSPQNFEPLSSEFCETFEETLEKLGQNYHNFAHVY